MNDANQPISQAYNYGSGNPPPIYQDMGGGQVAQAGFGGSGGSAAVSGTTSSINRFNSGLGKYIFEREDPDPTSAYVQCYYRSETDGQPDVMRL